MASSTPNTILLRVNGGDVDERPVNEAIVKAASPVTPGDLVIFDTGELKPNATAADVDAPNMWAVENPYIDPRVTTTAAIDTDYAAAATARFIYGQPGDVIYAWIEASHAAVVKGAPLESASGGDLQAYSTGRIVAFADENVDNSGGGSHARIRVRVA
jgi:hypothetical protein